MVPVHFLWDETENPEIDANTYERSYTKKVVSKISEREFLITGVGTRKQIRYFTL